jgi:hypothetical protein
MRLFTTFTLPSMRNQSCQNFTWLVLVDRRTPADYTEALKSTGYPNMQLVRTGSKNPWRKAFEPGDYDLLTTRIDNDDAFHKDVVKTIQQNWTEQRHNRPKPWVLTFPFGLILDLAGKQMFVMEYCFNNCPTLVEDAEDPRTIWQWDHSNIPGTVSKHYIADKPYWLQVIHSQNLLNKVPVDSPAKILHKQFHPKLEFLTYFGVRVEDLPEG